VLKTVRLSGIIAIISGIHTYASLAAAALFGKGAY